MDNIVLYGVHILARCMHTRTSDQVCPPCYPLQASAEMPFDGSGLDDVFLELTGEFSEILSLGPALPMFNDSGACFNAARKPTAAAAAAAADAPAGAASRQ